MGLNLVSAIRPRAYQAATWLYSRLRILTYHAIGTRVEGDADGLYNMAYARFEGHMRHLVEHYAGRFVPFKHPGPKHGALDIALTFDDGYRDNLKIAAPLLVELGIPFTLFVCTGSVSARKAEFLGPEEVRELAGLPGATIGAHSVSHARLTECDDRRLNEELAGSKAYLEDLLGSEVDSLAYPHGAVDRRVRDAAESAGYRFGASTQFDINPPARDPLLRCRTDIWAGDDLAIFAQKLRGDWDWRRWRYHDPARSA